MTVTARTLRRLLAWHFPEPKRAGRNELGDLSDEATETGCIGGSAQSFGQRTVVPCAYSIAVRSVELLNVSLIMPRERFWHYIGI